MAFNTRTTLAGNRKNSFSAALRLVNPYRGLAMSMALLVAVSLLVSWPLLIHGAPDLSLDGPDHARWAKQFATQFWDGDLYPRWLTNVNGGYGGPSLFFYPPLASYVSSIFWPLAAARDPQGWQVAGYAIVLAQVLSGIAAYLWLRSLVTSPSALLGAIVYVIAPYHLATDVYQRSASMELWVFVWLPLVLLSADGLLRRHRWAFLSATVTFALAVFSHPTISAPFALIPAAYVFFFGEAKERLRATATITAALLLGIALSAVYLLPAMLDQDKVYVAIQMAGPGDYHYHWILGADDISIASRHLYAMLTGNSNHLPRVTFRLRILEITLATLAAILALYLVIRRREKSPGLRRIALFYLGVTIFSFFLMNKASALLWDKTPFLKFIQYPLRFNVMLVFSVAVLAAVAGPYLRQRRAWPATLFLAVVVMNWLWVDGRSAAQGFSIWQAVAPNRIERKQLIARTQIDFPSAWPRPGNLRALNDASAFDRLMADHPPQTAQLEALSSGQVTGAASVESWQPRRVVLRIDAPQASQLTLNHFYYAGWRGRIDGAGTNLAVVPSPDGFIRLQVPQGTYDLIVELQRDRAERVGTMISLLALALLGCATVSALFSARTPWRRESLS